MSKSGSFAFRSLELCGAWIKASSVVQIWDWLLFCKKMWQLNTKQSLSHIAPTMIKQKFLARISWKKYYHYHWIIQQRKSLLFFFIEIPFPPWDGNIIWFSAEIAAAGLHWNPPLDPLTGYDWLRTLWRTEYCRCHICWFLLVCVNIYKSSNALKIRMI